MFSFKLFDKAFRCWIMSYHYFVSCKNIYVVAVAVSYPTNRNISTRIRICQVCMPGSLWINTLTCVVVCRLFIACGNYAGILKNEFLNWSIMASYQPIAILVVIYALYDVFFKTKNWQFTL